jgi:hypothetical protein
VFLEKPCAVWGEEKIFSIYKKFLFTKGILPSTAQLQATLTGGISTSRHGKQ